MSEEEEFGCRKLAVSSMAQHKLATFLKCLSETGNVSHSAASVGISRQYVQKLRKDNEEFALRWADAIEEAGDRLEFEARRRAFGGIVRKKFTAKGDPVMDPDTGTQYIEREYSDGLLTLLLKAHRPERFRELKEVKHSGSVEVKTVTVVRPANAKPLDENGFISRQSLNGNTNGASHG